MYHAEIDTTELLDRLSAARRRLGLRDGLRGAAWPALAAAVVTASLKLAALTRGVSPIALGLPGDEWRWAGGVLAVGLLVTALWWWRSRPDLLEMARRADRYFDLDERLSTAVELGSRGADGDQVSPVTAALYRDAAAHAARVDPRRLVPIGIPRPAIALALVAIGVLALELTSPDGRPGPAPGASILATVADGDAASAAELILDIAALVREQAERESNDYLRVVATSLERLAAEVIEQGSGGQAVADELARLLAHAEAAASSLSESDADADGFSPTLASIEEFLDAQAEAVVRADASTRESSDSEASSSSERSMAGAMMARARSMLESLRAALAGDAPDSEPLAGELAAADSSSSAAADASEDEESEDPSMSAMVATGDRPLANVDIGGGMVDVESDSEAGGPMQGVGGGASLAAAERMEIPDVSSSRDFELPTEGGSRRRLPDEIVPQTRFTEVTESPLPRGDWQQTTQENLSSGYLGVSYRDVVSRYFLSRIRLAEAEAESAEP
jgi:hypothetical protein